MLKFCQRGSIRAFSVSLLLCKEWADYALSRESGLLDFLGTLRGTLDKRIKEAQEELRIAQDYRHDCICTGHADGDVAQYFREMSFHDILPTLAASPAFKVPIAVPATSRRPETARWSEDEAWPFGFVGWHLRGRMVCHGFSCDATRCPKEDVDYFFFRPCGSSGSSFSCLLLLFAAFLSLNLQHCVLFCIVFWPNITRRNQI